MEELNGRFFCFFLYVFFKDERTINRRPDCGFVVRCSVFFRYIAYFISGIGADFHVIQIRLTTATVGKRRRQFSAQDDLHRRTNHSHQYCHRANSVATAMFRRIIVRLQVNFARAISGQVLFFTLYVVSVRYAAFFNRFREEAVNYRDRRLLCLLNGLYHFFHTMTRSRNNGRVTFNYSTRAYAASLRYFLLCLLPRITFTLFCFR